jgi:hypothetical protein
MERVVFTIQRQDFVITRDDILSAMKGYDGHYRVGNNDCGRLYAVKHDGKFYPPKHVLSLVVKKPRGSFGGGKNATNQVFLNLGFEIVSLGNGHRAAIRSRESVYDQAKMNAPIPDMQTLIKNLLSQKWTNLHANYPNLEDGEYPGGYLLAYSDQNLEGKQVKEEEIFYVGMTHAGITKRLSQFVQGIEVGRGHSGANRFFTDYANRVPYSQLPNRKNFFVACVTIPCVVNKRTRTPDHLRKMGEVARLEFYVLAHVKEKLQAEPELNKK